MSVTANYRVTYACDKCGACADGITLSWPYYDGAETPRPTLPDGWVHWRIGGMVDHHFCSVACCDAARAEINSTASAPQEGA